LRAFSAKFKIRVIFGTKKQDLIDRHRLCVSVAQRSPGRDQCAHTDAAKSGNDETRDAENATSEPKGHELVYAARVSLDHEQMQVDDRLVNLSPGMAVTVEILTGKRRIISYLLSPLARYTHYSLQGR
jgi:hemolysin D